MFSNYLYNFYPNLLCGNYSYDNPFRLNFIFTRSNDDEFLPSDLNTSQNFLVGVNFFKGWGYLCPMMLYKHKKMIRDLPAQTL